MNTIMGLGEREMLVCSDAKCLLYPSSRIGGWRAWVERLGFKDMGEGWVVREVNSIE